MQTFVGLRPNIENSQGPLCQNSPKIGFLSIWTFEIEDFLTKTCRIFVIIINSCGFSVSKRKIHFVFTFTLPFSWSWRNVPLIFHLRNWPSSNWDSFFSLASPWLSMFYAVERGSAKSGQLWIWQKSSACLQKSFFMSFQVKNRI